MKKFALYCFLSLASTSLFAGEWFGGSVWPVGKSCSYTRGYGEVWRDSVVGDTIVDGLSWQIIQRAYTNGLEAPEFWYVWETEEHGVWAGSAPDTSRAGLLFHGWLIENSPGYSLSIFEHALLLKDVKEEQLAEKFPRYQFPLTVTKAPPCTPIGGLKNYSGGSVPSWSSSYLIDCLYGEDTISVPIRYIYYSILDEDSAWKLYFKQDEFLRLAEKFPDLLSSGVEPHMDFGENSCTYKGESIVTEWGLPLAIDNRSILPTLSIISLRGDKIRITGCDAGCHVVIADITGTLLSSEYIVGEEQSLLALPGSRGLLIASVRSRQTTVSKVVVRSSVK